MPRAHGPIFCRKELREKVGVKVQFFNRRQNIGHTLRFFLSECHLAHTARYFIGAIVCDNDRRRPIVGLRHTDFSRLKSAHTVRFFVASSSDKESDRFFYRTKSQHTRTDFLCFVFIL